MHRDPLIGRLAAIAAVLALCVIVLGAWVRLSDAGLGCPDWPGCYGHLDVPRADNELEAANAAWPDRPVDTAKAWKEMVHRYFAGALGLLVFAIAAIAWRRRRRGAPVALPTCIAALVVLQALLGMWTVTLLLKPLVVLAHLLGGMALLSLLVWLALANARRLPLLPHPHRLRGYTWAALVVLVAQIGLGGWTSTNYAAVACPDLPTCQGEWWPPMDFATAFVPWHGLGIDYEGGILESPARTAIHMSHRLGAIVTTLVIGALALASLRRPYDRNLRLAGAGLLALLLAQLGLGLGNILWLLPLPVATAHNGVAALLLASLVAFAYLLRRSPTHH